jgi:hypothetical protein
LQHWPLADHSTLTSCRPAPLLLVLAPPLARAIAAAPAAADARLPPLLLAFEAAAAAACRAAADLPAGASCCLGFALLRVGPRLGVLPDWMKSRRCDTPALFCWHGMDGSKHGLVGCVSST